MTYSKSRSFKIGSNVLFKIASSNCQRPLAAPSLERLADNSAFRQKISDMLVAFDQAVKVPTARNPKITRIRLGTMIWSVMDLFFNAAPPPLAPNLNVHCHIMPRSLPSARALRADPPPRHAAAYFSAL